MDNNLFLMTIYKPHTTTMCTTLPRSLTALAVGPKDSQRDHDSMAGHVHTGRSPGVAVLLVAVGTKLAQEGIVPEWEDTVPGWEGTVPGREDTVPGREDTELG